MNENIERLRSLLGGLAPPADAPQPPPAVPIPAPAQTAPSVPAVAPAAACGEPPAASVAPAPVAVPSLQTSAPKVRARPFKPGVSGNPSGRRKGSVNLASALKRELDGKNADAIAAKLVEQAKAGQPHALKLAFEYGIGKGPLVSVEVGQQMSFEAAKKPIDWAAMEAVQREVLGLGPAEKDGGNGEPLTRKDLFRAVLFSAIRLD